MIKCIDVSKHQGNIDFIKVKASGITHVILRSSYTGWASGTKSTDPKFKTYIEAAHNAGLKIGIYHFSQALNANEAAKEADYCLDVIKPYKSCITLPVFIDWEFNKRLTAKKAKKLGKSVCTNICSAFCNKVIAAGYTPGVYANTSTFNNYLLVKALEANYKIWCAQYASKCTLDAKLYAWQYTSSGRVNGISGNVDMDYIYISEAAAYTGDFPTLLKPMGEKIAKKAEALAWPYGTEAKKATYPGGAPTAAYKEALNKAYPDRSGWSAPYKAGASCDIFVGTVVRSSGYDKDFPRGRGLNWTIGQMGHLEESKKWERVSVTKATIKPGDIIIYSTDKSGSKGHICICTGSKIAEASYNKFYGKITATLAARLDTSGKVKLRVYRSIGTYTAYLGEGDKGDDVKKLQRLLNWANGSALAIDGLFGPATLAAVKTFQGNNGLTIDGKFGPLSLAKAKTIKK